MHDDGYFGEPIAAKYDEDSAEMFAPQVVAPVVDFLANLAGAGRALELGIGTGRIALPLAQRGVSVHGIEMSKAMVKQLLTKPGGEDIDVTLGEFSTARVDGKFRVAYLVFNTIMNLTTQAAQTASFSNVASHLEPGGYFVVEAMMPKIQDLAPGETVQQFKQGIGGQGVDEYDVANQGLISHHLTLVDGQWEHRSIPFRYVWPSELNLMAEMAGMKLRERWSGWNREPFTSESEKFVAVWQKR